MQWRQTYSSIVQWLVCMCDAHKMVCVVLQVISCRAAVAWEAKQPLSIETVEVEPPREGEVRVQVNLTQTLVHTQCVYFVMREENVFL